MPTAPALPLPQLIGEEALKKMVVLPVVAEVTRTLPALMPAVLATPAVRAEPTAQAPPPVREDRGTEGDRALLVEMI